jgi:hypothetical protein
LREETVRGLRFLDNDDRMKTKIGLTEFTLKVTTLVTRMMKRWMSRSEELEEVSSREDRFSKIIFTLSRCRIIEDDSFRDLLSGSQMHVDEWDKVVLAAQ